MLSYAEDSEGDSDDVVIFKPKAQNRRPSKKRKVSESADEDIYEEADDVEEGTYGI